MVTRGLTSPTTGKMSTATVVEIEEIADKPVIVSLADGSRIRIRVDVIEVVRFDDEWDGEGHPLYQVRSGNIVAVLESPPELRRKLQ